MSLPKHGQNPAFTCQIVNCCKYSDRQSWEKQKRKLNNISRNIDEDNIYRGGEYRFCKNPEWQDKARLVYINHFGYYCTEYSEHNAEYSMFYIKNRSPELIRRYNILLDQWGGRYCEQIEGWKKEYAQLLEKGMKKHERSKEFVSRIMESCVTGSSYQIGGKCAEHGSSDQKFSGKGLCGSTVSCKLSMQLLTVEAAK